MDKPQFLGGVGDIGRSSGAEASKVATVVARVLFEKLRKVLEGPEVRFSTHHVDEVCTDSYVAAAKSWRHLTVGDKSGAFGERVVIKGDLMTTSLLEAGAEVNPFTGAHGKIAPLK